MRKLIFTLLLSTFGYFLLFSCKKADLSKVAIGEWSPDLALPLAFATFDVYDVFANSNSDDLIIIDEETGALALVYENYIPAFDGSDYVTVGDYGVSYSVSLSDFGGTDETSFTGEWTYSRTEEIGLSLNANSTGAELTEFAFDGGFLSLNLSSSFLHPIEVEISIPSLKKNGIPFHKTVGLAPAQGSNEVATLHENLAGYVVQFSSSPNYTIAVDYTATITGEGGAISSSDELGIEMNLMSMEMDYAKGYLGTRTINIPTDTVLLKLYEVAEGEGYFRLINPSVKLWLTNSFGFPIDLGINQLKTINTITGETYDLLGYEPHHLISFPSVIGDSAVTFIEFNRDNTTNIENVVEPTPKFLVVGTEVLTNPNGNTGVSNFVSKDSKFLIKSEVELPLQGFAHSFRFKDTTEFSSPGEAGNLKNVLFRLKIDNGFPINVFTKIKALDENYQEVFTVSDEDLLLIEAADVDGDGRAVGSKVKTTDIVLTEAQIQLLDEVKYLELSAHANTKDFETGKIIRIYDNYKLGMKLSGKFELKL